MGRIETGKRAWVPLLFIYVFTFFCLNLYNTISPQFTLRQVCLDLGLAPTCNDKAALKEAAAFGIPALLVPGVVSIIFIGIVGAFSNRLGRKNTLAIGILGQSFHAAGWCLVYFFPASCAPHWKLLVILGNAIHAVSGGILILFLAVFGVIGDISSAQPKMRTPLYIACDLISGVVGVAGSQVAGILMSHDSRIVLSLFTFGLLANVLAVYLILPETLEDSIRQLPVDLKKANTFGQLVFLLPVKSTKALLEADHDKIYTKIAKLYEKQQAGLHGSYISPNLDLDPSALASVSVDFAPASPTLSSGMLSPNQSTLNGIEFDLSSQYDGHDGIPTLGLAVEAVAAGVSNMPVALDHLEYAETIQDTIMGDSPLVDGMDSPAWSEPGDNRKIEGGNASPSPIFLPSTRGPLVPSSRAFVHSNPYEHQDDITGDDFKLDGALLPPGHGKSDDDEAVKSNKKSKKSKKSKEKEEETDHRGVPVLKLSEAPRRIAHGNSIGLLILCLFLLVLNFLGYMVVVLYYLKKKFNISSRDYSNVISVAAIVRAVGSFIVFPFVKKFIRTPSAEKNLLIVLCLLQATAFALLPFTTSFFQFCFGVVLYYISYTFPPGLIRSLCSNQVSQQLQHHVLGAIASIEVFVFVFAGVGFNLIWLETQDHAPSTVMFVWAGITVVAAALPLFISDSAADFNLRIEMTTQYTKIRTAEKKWESSQLKKKEQFSTDLDYDDANLNSGMVQRISIHDDGTEAI